ncbi:hypothetical protein EBR96_10670 [bacterium]|nr:hypothetical protein [bacterium]
MSSRVLSYRLGKLESVSKAGFLTGGGGNSGLALLFSNADAAALNRRDLSKGLMVLSGLSMGDIGMMV